jgi:hypothetical protein
MALPLVFDRELIARRLHRRPEDRDDFVMRLVIDDLKERLLTITRTFERALIIAPDAAMLPDEGVTATGRFGFERLATVLGGLDTELNGGAYARVAPFVPVSEVAGLLQRARFALPVGDVETHIVRYASPLNLMREVKALGASNPLADRPGKLATKRLIAIASAAYESLAGDPDGRVRATLEIVWMSGWAPHESQQKPLKPGSAEISLTKVLGKRD